MTQFYLLTNEESLNLPHPQFSLSLGFPGGTVVKVSACKCRRCKRSLSWEDPLQEEMATHFSILAWKIPWTEEPGGHGVTKSWTWQHNKNNQMEIILASTWWGWMKLAVWAKGSRLNPGSATCSLWTSEHWLMFPPPRIVGKFEWDSVMHRSQHTIHAQWRVAGVMMEAPLWGLSWNYACKCLPWWLRR